MREWYVFAFFGTECHITRAATTVLLGITILTAPLNARANIDVTSTIPRPQAGNEGFRAYTYGCTHIFGGHVVATLGIHSSIPYQQPVRFKNPHLALVCSVLQLVRSDPPSSGRCCPSTSGEDSPNHQFLLLLCPVCICGFGIEIRT